MTAGWNGMFHGKIVNYLKKLYQVFQDFREAFSSRTNNMKIIFKVGFSPSKKIVLFASLKALSK